MTDDSTFEGQWCYDSETGDEVLIDLKTHQEIMRRQRKVEI